MALRWRNHGRGKLLCAKYNESKINDSYIDDALHSKLDDFGVIQPIGEGYEWVWVKPDNASPKPAIEIYGNQSS